MLVVDDDPAAATLYKRILEEKMPVEVEAADTAGDARRMLATCEFDVVTIDYRLPDESGMALLEDLAEGEDTPPLVVVTAYGDVHLAARSFQLGAAGYVIKDFTLPRTLAGVVENAIAKAALERAADVLNQENAFRGAAVDALDEIFFVIDLEGRLMSWNSRLRQMTGLSDRELHLMDCAYIFTGEDKRRFLEEVTSLGKGEKAVIRLFISAADGGRIPYELNAVMLRDSDDLAVGVCAIGSEVAWSRKVKARPPEDVFGGEVADLTGEIIARVDYDGVFTYLNDTACSFWGKTRSELLGRSFIDLVHPDDVRASTETWSYAMRTGNIIKGLTNRQKTDRGWLQVEWNATPVYNDAEAFTGFQFTGRDVTDKLHAEEFLLRVNRELDAYAHTVSHDLKGPLSAIMLAADTLRVLLESQEAEHSPNGTLNEMADIISRYSEQAGSLVENLLKLAESGQVPTEIEVVDVGAAVRAVLDGLLTRISERNARVVLSEDLGRIVGNATQIKQVFSNLIGNAVMHCDAERPVIQVAYLGGEDRSHRYMIRDNGSGIPEEDLQDIFKLFHKGTGGGAGIGLATVEKIVRVYGGSVDAFNDNGACFEFTLKDVSRTAPAVT
jgi:PAS domain S-box-containing protein